jgi:hypothetical protein
MGNEPDGRGGRLQAGNLQRIKVVPWPDCLSSSRKRSPQPECLSFLDSGRLQWYPSGFIWFRPWLLYFANRFLRAANKGTDEERI